MIEVMCPEQELTSDLIEEAEQEIRHYMQQKRADTRAAFALFHRAIVWHDEQAWAGLYQLYSNLISAWIGHAVTPPCFAPDELAALINATFAKFAHSLSAEKFERFSSLEALLGYLKLCTRSVAYDELRRRNLYQCREEPLTTIENEPLVDDPAESIVISLAASDLWQLVCRELKDQKERLIFEQQCLFGRPPREIQQRYPHLFVDVETVYRIKRNALERLRRNQRLLAVLNRRACS